MNIKYLRDMCNFIIDRYGENVPMYMVLTESGKIKQTDYIIDAAYGSSGELFILNTTAQVFEMVNKG